MQRTESTAATWGWLVTAMGACALCCAGPLLGGVGLSALLAGSAAWLAGSWLLLAGGALAVVAAAAWLLRHRAGSQECCADGTVCTHGSRDNR